MGARERWAWATIATIWDSRVSAPTLSARRMKAPVRLMDPATRRAPLAFSTGMDSPVTRLSSTAPEPSSTSPSTGTFSPGRTRRRSPRATWSMATSWSVPSGLIRRAVLGARCSRALMAPEVASRARSSSIWPRSTRTTITAAASK